jgi:hypothetical protein
MTRPEGRYRVRFLRDAGARAVDPPGSVQPRAGDTWTLIWRPARDPLGDGCYEHYDNVGKGHDEIRRHFEANRHAGSWWSSYDIDGAFIFSDCQVEVLAGPLEP